MKREDKVKVVEIFNKIPEDLYKNRIRRWIDIYRLIEQTRTGRGDETFVFFSQRGAFTDNTMEVVQYKIRLQQLYLNIVTELDKYSFVDIDEMMNLFQVLKSGRVELLTAKDLENIAKLKMLCLELVHY
jgi:Fic family protein